jgi:hypothetical protein
VFSLGLQEEQVPLGRLQPDDDLVKVILAEDVEETAAVPNQCSLACIFSIERQLPALFSKDSVTRFACTVIKSVYCIQLRSCGVLLLKNMFPTE